ncbi:MAG: hypothetical protein N3F03_02060 [Ignavibacteria bacterium]|nr:hypothetical protein [Ignavibacteria bacterium]
METLASFHPKVVHFAIALLLTYVLLELLYLIFKKDWLNKSATLILLFGVLGAAASMLTGNQAYHYAESLFDNYDVKIPLGLIDEHEHYATWTIFWFLGILIIRFFLNLKNKFKGWLQIAVFVLSLVGIYFVYETGEYGGELVYKHGVGTKVIEKGIVPENQPNPTNQEKVEEEHEH